MSSVDRPTIDPPIMCEWTNCLHRTGMGVCKYCPLESAKSAPVDRPALAGAQVDIIREVCAKHGFQSRQLADDIAAALSAELKPVLYRYWQPSIKRWGYTEDPSMGQPLYAFGEKQ